MLDTACLAVSNLFCMCFFQNMSRVGVSHRVTPSSACLCPCNLGSHFEALIIILKGKYQLLADGNLCILNVWAQVQCPVCIKILFEHGCYKEIQDKSEILVESVKWCCLLVFILLLTLIFRKVSKVFDNRIAMTTYFGLLISVLSILPWRVLGWIVHIASAAYCLPEKIGSTQTSTQAPVFY